MRKNCQRRLVCVLSAAIMALSGCLKDTGTITYKLYKPVYESVDNIHAGIKNSLPQPVVQAGKMCILNNVIYLVELEKGVHVFDNSNPAAPVNKAFISIPGNEDIAVKGNMLYADCYSELVAIDISDINNIRLKSFVKDIFPGRRTVNGVYIYDPTKIPVSWEVRDTTVSAPVMDGLGMWTREGFISPVYLGNPVLLSASVSYASAANSNTGAVGSMTKMVIVNDRIYAVSENAMSSISINDPANPLSIGNNNLHLGIGAAETIYPFKDKLFIGSTSGMYIFSIADPDKPVKLSLFSHARVCDPVITDGTDAYITLHSGTSCGGIENEMQVVDVTDLTNPQLIKRYPLSSPRGLGKDGNTLFVCDDVDGLKIYDTTDPDNLFLRKTIPIANAYDVICLNKILYLSAKDGLYQFDYSDPANIRKLSTLNLH